VLLPDCSCAAATTTNAFIPTDLKNMERHPDLQRRCYLIFFNNNYSDGGNYFFKEKNENEKLLSIPVKVPATNP